MSLGYNSRLSQIGVGKADPVLSSFSPVGSSGAKVRAVEDVIVAQIQPRTSTPLQSSSISRSMVSADVSDLGAGMLAGEGMQSSTGSSSRRPTDGGLPNEDLGRLSISGRLSLGQPPATPLTRDRHTTANLASSSAPLVGADDGRRTSNAPPTTTRSEFIRDRFAPVDKPAPLPAPEPKGSLVAADATIGRLGSIPLNQPPDVHRHGSTGANPGPVVASMVSNSSGSNPISSTGNIPQLIRTLVEKSITDAMSEIKNDIQNLHVELIKQSLAQQNALHQIVANMPDMYKRLSDDHRILQEENERLKFRLGLDK